MAQTNELSTQLASHLVGSLQAGQCIEAAQIKVIGLEAIRAAAGGTWPAIAERVRRNSLDFIRGCLDEDDLVIPAGDGFLVIYSSNAKRDYELDSIALRDALNAFYVGEEGMQRLRAGVERRTVNASAVEGLIRGKTETPSPIKSSEIAFVPLWSARLELIGAYFATPVHRVGDEIRLGYDTRYAAMGRHLSCDFLDLDIELLERAIDGAQEVCEEGLRCLVGFSVHVTTLQNRNRWTVYRARLARVPRQLRATLAAKIAEIEPGTPAVTIADWVSRLNLAVSAVTLGLHPTDQGIAHLQSTRAQAVTVSFSECVRGDGAEFATCRRLIDRWTPALHRQRIGFCLDALENPELFAYACDAHVDAITGTKFWPAVATPSGVCTITRTEIMANMR